MNLIPKPGMSLIRKIQIISITVIKYLFNFFFNSKTQNNFFILSINLNSIDFKEETWKEYVQSLKLKYDEINNLLLDKTIKNNFNFESYKDLVTYLFNFPSDLGGLGETHNDQKYEDLNFFYYKPSGKIADLPQPEYKPNLNVSFINLELPVKSSNFNTNSEHNENENKKNYENSGIANEPNLAPGMGNAQQAYMNQMAYMNCMNYMRMMGMNMAAARQYQNGLMMQEYQKNLMLQQNEEENEKHSKQKKEKSKL